jgi:hypothetical protein
MVGAGGVRWQRESAFLFHMFLKPTLIHGEGRPRRFPSNNESVGNRMGSSQPDAGGLGHPRATYISPKLFLLSCLKVPLKGNIPKTSLLGVAEGGQFIFSICFELTRGSRSYLYREIISPISFSWGSFGHKGSELLSSIAKVPPVDLSCSWRACQFAEINSLFSRFGS